MNEEQILFHLDLSQEVDINELGEQLLEIAYGTERNYQLLTIS
jgi:hypothetical protein